MAHKKPKPGYRSCTERCAAKFGAGGHKVAGVILVPEERGSGLVSWKGWKVAAIICTYHLSQATHIFHSHSDADGIHAGALLGPSTVSKLFRQVKP